MTPPSTDIAGVWVGLARAHHSALSAIEAALKEAGLPPLSWYDVLLELDRAGDTGLRAFELAEKLLLPQYGLSRLLGRIEKAGYLARRSCAEDGRGHLLVITRPGMKLRRRMWPVYARAMDMGIGAKLGRGDAVKLSQLLKKLV